MNKTLPGTPNCADVIRVSLQKAGTQTFLENAWGARHAIAFRMPKGVERPIVAFYTAFADYADRHRRRYGSLIGEDGSLGPALLSILKSIRVLLNGELGRLDAGTLDALLYDLAEAAGFTAEELE